MSYDEQIKKLVITRLSAMPPNVSFSIGDYDGKFTKDDLIREVKKGTATGEAIVAMELDLIRQMPRLSAELSE